MTDHIKNQSFAIQANLAKIAVRAGSLKQELVHFEGASKVIAVEDPFRRSP